MNISEIIKKNNIKFKEKNLKDYLIMNLKMKLY